tara:strand:+ start:1998 stop:2729 length:732 start_codon:yes stop_codon:yes gene_type:complete
MFISIGAGLNSLRQYFEIKYQLDYQAFNVEANLFPVEGTPLKDFWWVYDGDLTDAGADQLAQLITTQENFGWLTINSLGGEATAADRMINLLNNNGIKVYIHKHGTCYSACVKVLLKTDRDRRIMIDNSNFLIGIHRARLGDGIYPRYFLEKFDNESFEPTVMREWIHAYSQAVGDFLDDCPSSPFELDEGFFLTKDQFLEIMHGKNAYSCADIWHQDIEWQKSVLSSWHDEADAVGTLPISH